MDIGLITGCVGVGVRSMTYLRVHWRFRVDCKLVVGCGSIATIFILSTASREFGIVWGYTIA